MKQISTCYTHDLTDQLHLLVHVKFRTGGYDCLRSEGINLIPDPTRQHRSTDDKHYSGFMLKNSDEVQLRGNSVFSYDHRVVRSLRVQDMPGSLGCMFPTIIEFPNSHVINQNIHLHN